jgi:glucosyl-dolichyl phosphate glucuronosyltransferase
VLDQMTVVIACHTMDRWPTLTLAARSALEQDPPPQAVVIAVDHNPELSARLRAQLPEVAVVDNTSARGASGARNAGAAAAATPFVAFLDDDAIARPGWLRALLEPFRDPDVVGTGGSVTPRWSTERPAWFPDEFGWVIGVSYTGLPTTVAPIRNVWSENMAVRRDAFDAVGGFRAGFGKLGNRSRPEDTDLCIRMTGGGRRGHWMFVPAAVVEHLVPPDRERFGFFLRRSYAEGRGKTEMAEDLASEGDLGAEGSFVLRIAPAGMARNVWAAARERRPEPALRALAILLGLAAAALGALSGLAARRVQARDAAKPA